MSPQPDEHTPLTTTTNNDNADPQKGGFPTWATLLRQGHIVEVKGSTARDHLANERTYLAWMRTGLALIGASLAMLKWPEMSNVVAHLVALIGVVALVMATERYFRNMRLLEGGMYEPNVHGVLIVVTVVVTAIGTAFVMQWKHAAEQM